MNEAASRALAPVTRVRRVKLQHILFLLLLLPGIIPLVLSSFYLLRSNREALQVKETELLTLSAQGFAQLLSDDLAQRAAQLRQVGQGLLAAPGFSTLDQRLRQDWAKSYIQRFITQERRDLRAFRFGDQNGSGQALDMTQLAPAVNEAMLEAFNEAVGTEATVYRFVLIKEGAKQTPAVAIAVAVAIPESGDQLILQALTPLTMDRASGKGIDLEELFLIDAGGARLWSANERPMIEEALLASDLVQQFAALPVNVTSEIQLEVDGHEQSILAQVVPVRETGWGVVAHKTTQAAFQQVRLLVVRILMFSALAAVLALALALFASHGLSLPIQRLAETTHQIAAGHFDRRVSTEGLSFEVAELAEDFNRMSDTVESYIERLQRAAEVNRQLFISSIRAFAAAIDAKDPYTRGHSERVARYSRAIARYLGLPKDMLEKVWISAVLHDVGKIGVEDRVLKKHGVLTDEEYEQMKLHPVIGADIVEPISELREHLPGIRWHHEAWNGSGYPDGLKGEQIPLMARIIGVADTFDAITTNRPYQTASSPDFAIQTVKKLTGTRFDARIVTGFLLAWDAGQIQMDPPSPESSLPPAPFPSPEEAARSATPEPKVPKPTVPNIESTLDPAPPEMSMAPSAPARSAPASGASLPHRAIREPTVPRIESRLDPAPPEMLISSGISASSASASSASASSASASSASASSASASSASSPHLDIRKPTVPRIESRLDPAPPEMTPGPPAAQPSAPVPRSPDRSPEPLAPGSATKLR